MKLVVATVFLSCAVLNVFAINCHQSAKDMDDCFLRVEKSQDYKKLKDQEKAALKVCVSANPGTTCQISSVQGEKCRDNARADANLKAALKTMYSGIDACFDGKITSPYSVLRMTGDMGAVAHRKGVRPSGGGTTTPAPLVLDNTDISTDANASAGSSTSSSTAGCPASSADSSSILGGSSTDISGNSAISDPSALFGGLGGSGGLSSLGSLTGGGGLPGGLDASALTSLFSGGRKRRQTNDCDAIFKCLATGKQKGNDKDVSQRAIRVYDAIQKCKGDNHPSLACLPSTKKQKECVNAAKQDYHVKLTAFITACVGQTTNTQNGV